MTEQKAPAAHSFGQFLAMLEDGQLQQELTDQLTEISAGLNDFVAENGGKPRAKLTLNIAFRLDGGVFTIEAEHKTTLPKAKRRASIAWSTPENRFTPMNPAQMNLFAPRSVDTETGETRVV
jgi:hypothetical protein